MYNNIKQLDSENKIFTALMIISFFILFTLPVQGEDAKVNDLKKLYQNSCAKCHGPDGSAIDADGNKLKGKDFTDQKWLNETKDEKMVKVILDGKFFGLAMPAYKELLTQEEARLMVTEIIRKSVKGKLIRPDSE